MELQTLPVIASEAKQSIARHKERMDCFRLRLLATADKSSPPFKYDFAIPRRDSPGLFP